MAKTFSIGPVSDDPPVAVTVQTVCREVRIEESRAVTNWPTVSYDFSAPAASDDALRKFIGTSLEIRSPGNSFFAPGNVLGYLTSAGGPEFDIASTARTTNVVTITTVAAHGFVTGQEIQIAGVTDSSFDGNFTITVTGTTTFTYSQVGGDTTSSGGTAKVITSTFVQYEE